MQKVLSWALLGMVCALPGAQDPPAPVPAAPDITITQSVKGETGDLLHVQVVTQGPIVKWGSPNKKLQMIPSELLNNPKVAIVTSKYPGTYSLYAWTAINGKPTDWVECKVTVTGITPPTPGPTPTPAPTVKKVVLYVVYEPTTLTPPDAAIVSNKALWDAIEAKGTLVFVADRNSKEAAAKKLSAPVDQAGTGYPALIFAELGDNNTAKVLKTIKLPATQEAVLAAVKEVTG